MNSAYRRLVLSPASGERGGRSAQFGSLDEVNNLLHQILCFKTFITGHNNHILLFCLHFKKSIIFYMALYLISARKT
jgi:hypothetical protein